MERCVHVENKLTMTSSQLTVDRSTLTRRPPESCHRSTETDPQQQVTNGQFTPPTQLNSTRLNCCDCGGDNAMTSLAL